jgi:hypothetical protein
VKFWNFGIAISCIGPIVAANCATINEFEMYTDYGNVYDQYGEHILHALKLCPNLTKIKVCSFSFYLSILTCSKLFKCLNFIDVNRYLPVPYDRQTKEQR